MKPIQADTHIPITSDPNERQMESGSPSLQTTQAERTIENDEAETHTVPPLHTHITSDADRPATMMNDELLSSLFSGNEDATTLVRRLLHILHMLQKKTTLKQRFHLFVETDHGLARNSSEDSDSEMHRVQTRIAFSPTLSSSYPQQTSGLSRLYGELIQMSFAKAPTGSTCLQELVNRTPTRQPIRRSGPASFLSRPRPDEFAASTPSNITTSAIWPRNIVDHLNALFPRWCPYPDAKYTSDEPESSHDYILLEEEVVDIFRRLEDFQIAWVYQELFKFIHQQGRKNRRLGMARTLTYSQFTPPWLRERIIVKPVGGGEITDVDQLPDAVTLKKVSLTHLRNERNTQGYRRIRFILAAFYTYERDCVKPLFDHLLKIVPLQRSILRRKCSNKRRTTVGERSRRRHTEQTSSLVDTPRNGNPVRPQARNRTEISDTTEAQRNQTDPPSVPGITNSTSPCHTPAARPPLPRNNSTRTGEKGIAISNQREGLELTQDKPQGNVGDLPLLGEDTINATNVTPQNRGASIPSAIQKDRIGKRMRGHEGRSQITKSVFHGIQPSMSHFDGTANQAANLSEGNIEIATGDPNTSVRNEGSGPLSLPNEEAPGGDIPQPKRLKESIPGSDDHPATPFSSYSNDEQLGNLQCEDEDEPDEDIWNDSTNPTVNLEEDILSGAVKCGALALCPWFTVPSMQQTNALLAKCMKCKVHMHRACHKTNPLCNYCRKKYFVKSLKKACKY